MKYNGVVDEEGMVHMDYQVAFRRELKNLSGKRVSVEIKPFKKHRSNQQNNYYHGVIVPIFTQLFVSAGFDFDAEQTHSILKTRFLLQELPYPRIKSTAELSTEEFIEYCMQCQKWASEQFNFQIPNPNE